MTYHWHLVLACCLYGLLCTVGLAQENRPSQQQQTPGQKEEERDYFKKWLNQDVTYIISEEERAIFSTLATPEEKERFIEQFWQRRDPDPRTSVNEFKEEHYRRIAYANDHYESGFAGWKTDRGRIYILFGPPDSIDAHASGGAYDRPVHEGGGATATFPFEVWRYRYIEGIGDGVELEFVDKSWTGDYQLALNADEKDVFLRVPGHGETLAEAIGLSTRLERLNLSGATRELYPMMHHRIKDSPFARYETYSKMTAPPDFKHPELREVVGVDIAFEQLPFQVRSDYFKLGGDRILVPLSLQVSNRELTYEPEGELQVARVAVYGALTTLNGQVIYEFEDDFSSVFRPEAFEQGKTGRTLYQKQLLVESRTRYKLDLVVKDLNSGRIGALKKGLVPPFGKPEPALEASSLVLADYIEQLAAIPESETMFVLGDIKVRPNLRRTFPAGGVVGIYFQLYEAQLDQSTLLPSVRISYRIRQGEKSFLQMDEGTESIPNIYADGRMVVAKGLPLQDLPEGEYVVEVKAEDLLTNQQVSLSEPFRIVAPTSVAQSSRR